MAKMLGKAKFRCRIGTNWWMFGQFRERRIHPHFPCSFISSNRKSEIPAERAMKLLQRAALGLTQGFVNSFLAVVPPAVALLQKILFRAQPTAAPCNQPQYPSLSLPPYDAHAASSAISSSSSFSFFFGAAAGLAGSAVGTSGSDGVGPTFNS